MSEGGVDFNQLALMHRLSSSGGEGGGGGGGEAGKFLFVLPNSQGFGVQMDPKQAAIFKLLNDMFPAFNLNASGRGLFAKIAEKILKAIQETGGKFVEKVKAAVEQHQGDHGVRPSATPDMSHGGGMER